jgi:hypothetical protein
VSYDVGKIRKAALGIFDVRPGPGSALVLIEAAQKANEGLKERRDRLSALIGYEGAQQWDKDYSRYVAWLDEASVTAKQVLAPGATTPTWAAKYAVMLKELFLGGLRARASYWATLSNQLDALEESERTTSEQTSWFVLWWAQPAANAAAAIADAYDLKQVQTDYAEWSEKVAKARDNFIKAGLGIVGIVAIGAGLYFFGPVVAAGLFGASRSGD